MKCYQPALATRLATISPQTYGAKTGKSSVKEMNLSQKEDEKEKTNESDEMDERTLTKSQQDRLDDLEAFLGHLQRLRTPST